MKKYFAYIRVSTAKQGTHGSSLQEQQSAIEAYALRHGLTIVEWFEERETAAKLGRPLFSAMFKRLKAGHAAGVITHKIDRSARNLEDWAALGKLFDSGVELHFAHESLDLSTRGGRLAADIQAVVAADYIRNLREETRKGFYGRLKQGLLPMAAPIGYLDQGGGKAKIIDPERGPLIAAGIKLYATGAWSLDGLSVEMFRRGLRTKSGRPVSITGWSRILNSSFYMGLIKLRKTGEVFQGVHEPLVDPITYDCVQRVLRGRLTHKGNFNLFRYQRLFRCSGCARSLVASKHKGRIYYRCQTKTCPTTVLREDAIDGALGKVGGKFAMPEQEWQALSADVDAWLACSRDDSGEGLKNLLLLLAANDDRMARLTDAFIDQAIDREAYLARKEKLLHERANLLSQKTDFESGTTTRRKRAEEILELAKELGCLAILENDERRRRLLKRATSNRRVNGKEIVVEWEKPFSHIVSDDALTLGAPHRGKARTFRDRLLNVIIEDATAFSKRSDTQAQNG